MSFLEWLQETALATTIRDSAVLLGALSGLHLVGFTLLAGGVLVSTLRLAGVFLAEHDRVTITEPASRGVALGLALSVITGALLFAPRAVDASHNGTFQIKMLLLAVAAGFQFTIHRAVGRNAGSTRTTQRIVGLMAFIAWVGVALAGCAFILLE